MLSQHRVRQKLRMVRAFLQSLTYFHGHEMLLSNNSFKEVATMQYTRTSNLRVLEHSFTRPLPIMATANQSNSVRESENKKNADSTKSGMLAAKMVQSQPDQSHRFKRLYMCIDSLLSHRFITSHILKSLQLQHLCFLQRLCFIIVE